MLCPLLLPVISGASLKTAAKLLLIFNVVIRLGEKFLSAMETEFDLYL